MRNLRNSSLRWRRKHLPITLPVATSRAANSEVVPLRSWVRRSACPGRQQRLRAVLHLAFLVDAQRPAGTGRPAPSRRTADLSTGSRCGGVQKAFRIRGRRPTALDMERRVGGARRRFASVESRRRCRRHAAAHPDEVRREGRRDGAPQSGGGACPLSPRSSSISPPCWSALPPPRARRGASAPSCSSARCSRSPNPDISPERMGHWQYM